MILGHLNHEYFLTHYLKSMVVPFEAESSKMANNVWPKSGPYLQFSLAHTWFDLTALTESEYGCLNSKCLSKRQMSTKRGSILHLLWAFVPHMALTTPALYHVKLAYDAYMPHLWPSS